MPARVLFVRNDPTAPEALLGAVFAEFGFATDTFDVLPRQRPGDFAVDPVIEAEILGGLRQGDTTTVVIAHRLSTILLADRVVHLDQGAVRGIGTHQELLAHPEYAALVTAYEEESELDPVEQDLSDRTPTPRSVAQNRGELRGSAQQNGGGGGIGAGGQVRAG